MKSKAMDLIQRFSSHACLISKVGSPNFNPEFRANSEMKLVSEFHTHTIHRTLTKRCKRHGECV